MLGATFQRLADVGMVQCPTLVVMAGIAQAADESLRDPAMLAYAPSHLMGFWTSGRYQEMGKLTRRALPQMQAAVKELWRHDVPLAIGTDLTNSFVFAGFSVHEEMKLFQEAGIPAAGILRAATLTPARYCGVDDRLGSIGPGKTASMVLVRRNSLVDIRHASEIEAVISRGEVFDRAALDELLAEAREASGSDTPDEAEADAGSGLLSPPGELIARGNLEMKFTGFDAGREEFALSKHDGGYRLQTRYLPKGGFEKPSYVDFAHDADGRFTEGIFRELSDKPHVATYARDDRQLEAFGQRDGEILAPISVPMGPDSVLDTPVFAGGFLLRKRLDLAEGESRTVAEVGVGRPDWRPVSSNLKYERLDDLDGVQRYAVTYETPSGSIRVVTFTDENGVVNRAELTMPMGKITAELQE